MTRQIPEKDWKKFKLIHPIALERFRVQILEEIEIINSQGSQNVQTKYGKIYKLIKDRDREMGNIFNDFRRSTALMQLHMMHSHGLLKPEEIEEFTEETQKVLSFLS